MPTGSPISFQKSAYSYLLNELMGSDKIVGIEPKDLQLASDHTVADSTRIIVWNVLSDRFPMVVIAEINHSGIFFSIKHS